MDIGDDDCFAVDFDDMDTIQKYQGVSTIKHSIWWYVQRYNNSAYNIAKEAINRARSLNDDK